MAYARDGVVAPERGPRGQYRFSMQDLLVLRTARGLSTRVGAPKVRRALRSLRAQQERPLAALSLTAVGDEVAVRDGRTLWKAESGQGVLDFEAPPAAPAPPLRLVPAPAVPRPSATSLFERALALEEDEDLAAARAAYEAVLDVDPGNAAALVNLGRLRHEAGDARGAVALYRRALDVDPANGTAAFDLGVALEDLGRPQDAVAAYEHALDIEPEAADAHYNLARLHERAGRRTEAFQHLKAYRQLTRGR